MNPKILFGSTLVSAMLCASPSVLAQSQTQSEQELDVMMGVVGEDDSADDVVNRIELPAPQTGVQLERGVNGTVDPQELERVKAVVNELLQDTDSTLNNAVNDALSSGDIEKLPQVIKDNLPEELVDELDSDVDDLTDELVDDLDTGADDLTGDLPLSSP